MPAGSAGYQPRNTPAERRAFFDLQKQIKALIANGGGGGGAASEPSGFCASTTTMVPGTAQTKIPLTTALWNDGDFTIVNGEAVCQAAGRYLAIVRCAPNSMTAGANGRVNASLFLNGGNSIPQVSMLFPLASGLARPIFEGVGIINLTVGDSVSYSSFVDAGLAGTITLNGPDSTLTLERVGGPQGPPGELTQAAADARYVQIADTGWQTGALPSGMTSATIEYRKVGGQVMITFSATKNGTALNGQQDWLVLPAGYWPTRTIRGSGVTYASSAATAAFQTSLRVNVGSASGTLVSIGSHAANCYIQGSISYPV